MRDNILEKLREYCAGDFYPFHMPGHKRNPAFAELLPGCGIDITEIGGFDNLHHAEGILKEAQERAAQLYGVKRTFFSVNGSTAALLSSISAAVSENGKILIGRNCHKSVYHGIYLRKLTPVYIYPQWNSVCGLNGGILPEDVENALKKEPEIQAVLLTSPTYDGMVSDIQKIAEIVHGYGIPLIVDEAHGAHFPFSEYFPDSAIQMGADVVIHSVHKTLPSLTQTALLHQVTDRISEKRLARFMGIYQSSSPSYLLMGAMDSCITFLKDKGKEFFEVYVQNLQMTRKELEKLEKLEVSGREWIGRYGIFDMDLSKIVLSGRRCGITGTELHEQFRGYGIEMEMETDSYVLALSSVGDRLEGLERLWKAAKEIDAGLLASGRNLTERRPAPPRLKQNMKLGLAMEKSGEVIPLRESAGRVSGEFVYLYPPGIPLAAPGEVLTEEMIEYLLVCQEKGLELQGLEDYRGKNIQVIPFP